MKNKIQELLTIEMVSEFLEELVLGAGAVEVAGGIGERNGGWRWQEMLLGGTR
jgi:hypothetical protein